MTWLCRPVGRAGPFSRRRRGTESSALLRRPARRGLRRMSNGWRPHGHRPRSLHSEPAAPAGTAAVAADGASRTNGSALLFGGTRGAPRSSVPAAGLESSRRRGGLGPWSRCHLPTPRWDSRGAAGCSALLRPAALQNALYENGGGAEISAAHIKPKPGV